MQIRLDVDIHDLEFIKPDTANGVTNFFLIPADLANRTTRH
jgi:hypothetical protein